MDNLKQFKVPIKDYCNLCGKREIKLSIIRYKTWNANHFYSNSHRPFQLQYKLKLCKKCFNKTDKQIRKIMI